MTGAGRRARGRESAGNAPVARAQAEGPKLPSLAALNQATRATAAALADPEMTVWDVYRAAELEAATLHAYWQTPGVQAKHELETRGPEPEAEL
jgi:hypothetical protein